MNSMPCCRTACRPGRTTCRFSPGAAQCYRSASIFNPIELSLDQPSGVQRTEELWPNTKRRSARTRVVAVKRRKAATTAAPTAKGRRLRRTSPADADIPAARCKCEVSWQQFASSAGSYPWRWVHRQSRGSAIGRAGRGRADHPERRSRRDPTRGVRSLAEAAIAGLYHPAFDPELTRGRGSRVNPRF